MSNKEFRIMKFLSFVIHYSLFDILRFKRIYSVLSCPSCLNLTLVNYNPRPNKGQYSHTIRLKTSQALKDAKIPTFAISAKDKYPEETAIAFAGVDMGRVKASPAGMAIAKVRIFGSR